MSALDVALLLGLGLLAVLVLRALRPVLRILRAPPDPRAGWPTFVGTPVWFVDRSSGARWMCNDSPDRLIVGASGDCKVPRTRPRHAQIRVFGRVSVDIAPIGGASVHIGGKQIHGPVWLEDDDDVRLGDVELAARIGWLPDPEDPWIGTIVAGERLLERIADRRYRAARVTVELLATPTDAAGYRARIEVSERTTPDLLHVRRVEAGAIVVDASGEPRPGALDPEALITMAGIVARLHAAGIAHGDLDRAVLVASGRLRLWPVAPAGALQADLEALARRLPPSFPPPELHDVRSFMRAVLQHGVRTRLAFRGWTLIACPRCGEPFARVGPTNTTMFDGHDPSTGRRLGGQTRETRTECLVCGHVDVRFESEAYEPGAP